MLDHTGLFVELTQFFLSYGRIQLQWNASLGRKFFGRGPAASSLSYDFRCDCVLLDKLFRPEAILGGRGAWQLKPEAGVCDDKETVAQTIRCEAMGEKGCSLKELGQICEHYVSPRCINEKVTIFCLQRNSRKVSEIGCATYEYEGTIVTVVPFQELKQQIGAGTFKYVLTLFSVQWLLLNGTELHANRA